MRSPEAIARSRAKDAARVRVVCRRCRKVPARGRCEPCRRFHAARWRQMYSRTGEAFSAALVRQTSAMGLRGML